jgi:hypothetical protein
LSGVVKFLFLKKCSGPDEFYWVQNVRIRVPFANLAGQLEQIRAPFANYGFFVEIRVPCANFGGQGVQIRTPFLDRLEFGGIMYIMGMRIRAPFYENAVSYLHHLAFDV